MPGLSVREFARREGCSHTLVQKALKSEHLRAFANGTLDPALVGTGWRKGNRRAGTVGNLGGNSGQQVATPTAPEVEAAPEPQPHGGALRRARKADREDPDGDALAALDELLLGGQRLSLAEAERIKENALALKHVLDARQRSGALVALERAEATLFELARASRDSWLNWPARIGPLLAADLGVAADQVTEKLTAHVHAHLADLGEPEPDFTARGA